jgi:5-methylcytosine-specific restriction protein A
VRCDVQDGKMPLLFEALGRRQPVKFIGEFACATYDFQEGPDSDGNLRKTIRFHLLPVGSGAVTASNEEDEIDLPISRGVTLSELRQQAFNAVLPEDADNWKEAKVRRRLRSVAMRRYMLARANGVCELTGDPASFLTTSGLPNLEVYHINRRSDGGLDDARNCAAMTPTAHREIHHRQDGERLNKELLKIVHEKEQQIGSLATL